VIRDFLNPDFTLIGEFDERSGSVLEQAYAGILLKNPPCKRMTLENAELAKISVNTFVTMKISFANMLADLCERIPGGDVDVVSDALGADTRIGRKYLTGALGYGGPCFPRDNVALSFLARALGTQADLAEATDARNRTVADSMLQKIQPYIAKGATVAVLGLAYKPASVVVDESQGVALAQAVSRAGARVVAYDPLAANTARNVLQEVVILDSLEECLAQADVVLVATPDTAFRDLSVAELVGDKEHVTVVDFWRVLGPEIGLDPRIDCVRIGLGAGDPSLATSLASMWQPSDEAIEPKAPTQVVVAEAGND